jgi:hypothetical protein
MLREMPSSGVYTASAPTERPARVAMYPDAPPCVSTTNTRRRDDDADWRKVSQYSVRELRHVSLPSEYSVPGTLLLIVAGNSTMGIFISSYSSRARRSSLSAAKASNPPITKRA